MQPGEWEQSRGSFLYSVGVNSQEDHLVHSTSHSFTGIRRQTLSYAASFPYLDIGPEGVPLAPGVPQPL